MAFARPPRRLCAFAFVVGTLTAFTISGCKARGTSGVKEDESFASNGEGTLEELLLGLEAQAQQEASFFGIDLAGDVQVPRDTAYALGDAAASAPDLTIAQLQAQLPILQAEFQKLLARDPSTLIERKQPENGDGNAKAQLSSVLAKTAVDLGRLKAAIPTATKREEALANEVVNSLTKVVGGQMGADAVEAEPVKVCPVEELSFSYFPTTTKAAGAYIELKIGLAAIPAYWQRLCPKIRAITVLQNPALRLTYDLRSLDGIEGAGDGSAMISSDAEYVVAFGTDKRWHADEVATQGIRRTNEAFVAYGPVLAKLKADEEARLKALQEAVDKVVALGCDAEDRCCAIAEFQKTHPGKQGYYDKVKKTCIRTHQ